MMAGSSSYAIKLLLAAIFVWLQAHSLAHAAEHGDEHHEHDGVECELTVFISEDLAILPNPPVELQAPLVHQQSVEDAFLPWQRVWPPERGPPPRGPPSSFGI